MAQQDEQDCDGAQSVHVGAKLAVARSGARLVAGREEPLVIGPHHGLHYGRFTVSGTTPLARSRREPVTLLGASGSGLGDGFGTPPDLWAASIRGCCESPAHLGQR